MIPATITRLAPRLGALALLAMLGACQDSTAPATGAFNANRVVAGVAAVEKVAASSALGSLQQVTRFGGDAALSAARLAPDTWSPGLAGAVSRISGSAVDAGTFLIPVMRASALGKVFTYDATLKRYVPSTRTGAPANGVRFVLYDEGANNEPITSREIGYADLTDEKRATAGVAGIKLVVVIDGVTRLSYAFDVSVPGGAPNLNVQGFVVDGEDRLNFTIGASSALLGSGPATVQATIEAPRQGFEVKATLKGAPNDRRNGEIDLVITSASDELVVDASTVNGVLDATFTVNGTLFARAKGSVESPVITGENGRALTPDELRALQKVVDMADAVFSLVDDLVEPAGRILLLALGVGV